MYRPTEKAAFVVQRPTDSWASRAGEPYVAGAIPASPGSACPRCGSAQLLMMKVKVENEYLLSGFGLGTFAKCGSPGCDWESEETMAVDSSFADKT